MTIDPFYLFSFSFIFLVGHYTLFIDPLSRKSTERIQGARRIVGEMMQPELKPLLEKLDQTAASEHPEKAFEILKGWIEKWTIIGEISEEFESLNGMSQLSVALFIAATVAGLFSVLSPDQIFVGSWLFSDLSFYCSGGGVLVVAAYLWRHQRFSAKLSKIELTQTAEEQKKV